MSNRLLYQLEDLEEIFSEESAWIKGTYARDSLGDAVYHGDEDAVCFCLVGAIRKITLHKTTLDCHRLVEALQNTSAVRQFSETIVEDIKHDLYIWNNLVRFNDQAESVEEIRAVIREAIQLTKEKAL